MRQSFILGLAQFIVDRVFANGQRDRSSMPGRVILKNQKMVLDTSLLNTQYYKERIMGKSNNPLKRIILFASSRRSNGKKARWVALDFGRLTALNNF